MIQLGIDPNRRTRAAPGCGSSITGRNIRPDPPARHKGRFRLGAPKPRGDNEQQTLEVYGSRVNWETLLGHSRFGFKQCVGYRVKASPTSRIQRFEDAKLLIGIHPTPKGLTVTQWSGASSDTGYRDFVVIEYVLANTGASAINDLINIDFQSLAQDMAQALQDQAARVAAPSASRPMLTCSSTACPSCGRVVIPGDTRAGRARSGMDRLAMRPSGQAALVEGIRWRRVTTFSA